MYGRLVTFVLITYNQEQFVRDAMVGALSQTYSPLEIVISDDCSTDSTFEIINEVANAYDGPHRVVLNRNKFNLGIAGNVNKAFELASGVFFVVAAGDDISVPHRTARLLKRYCFGKNVNADLVCSYFEEIDVRGTPTGNVGRDVAFLQNSNQGIHKWRCETVGACNGYSRKLYDKYGPLDTNIIGEDWIYFFRAWLEAGAAVVEEPLVQRRVHEGSVMSLHADIDSREKEVRTSLRRSSREAELARGRQWLKDYQISGKELDRKRCAQFVRWITLMELESEAAKTTRIRSIGIATRIFFRFGDMRRVARIVLRSVLRIC